MFHKSGSRLVNHSNSNFLEKVLAEEFQVGKKIKD
jgi:hypothetical protein